MPPITAQDAEREPEADRLFGPSFDRRQAALRTQGARAEHVPREQTLQLARTTMAVGRPKTIARH